MSSAARFQTNPNERSQRGYQPNQKMRQDEEPHSGLTDGPAFAHRGPQSWPVQAGAPTRVPGGPIPPPLPSRHSYAQPQLHAFGDARRRAGPYASICNADLWVLEHIAARYDLPDSLVESFRQAVLAQVPNAELPSWLSARVLLRVVSKQLPQIRKWIGSQLQGDASTGALAGASVERLLDSLSNLANYISRDQDLPARHQQDLRPSGSLMADVKHLAVMVALQRQTGFDGNSNAGSGGDLFRLADSLVQRTFFPSHPPQAVEVTQEERARGMELSGRLQHNHGHPFEVLGGTGTLTALQQQVESSISTYHDAAQASLGNTTLHFIQNDLKDCAIQKYPPHLPGSVPPRTQGAQQGGPPSNGRPATTPIPYPSENLSQIGETNP